MADIKKKSASDVLIFTLPSPTSKKVFINKVSIIYDIWKKIMQIIYIMYILF